MENASKALIMAAEILVGIMIISIGTYLFNLFASYSKENYEMMESTQIAEFNNRFLKFEGTNTYKTSEGEKSIPIACTIHDVVGLANFAQKYNLQNELLVPQADGNFETIPGDLSNSLYIQINFLTKGSIEKYSSNKLTELVKTYDLNSIYDSELDKNITNPRYFVCICEINESSKRVNKVTFTEFTEAQYEIIQEINGN